jgi:hypothetical protein
MRERALTFGPANLVGILTQPDPDVAVPGAPAMVILNSGILHRAGASRIYVQIARALALDGLTSLRFDFSGVGDSEVRRDSIPIEQRFVMETREAMDYLDETLGIDRFLVGGLCSGGDGAFWAGLEDERVGGVWQIDAFCYPTLGYYRRRYLPKILDPGAWWHSIKVRMQQAASEPETGDDEVFVKPEYRRIFPPKEEVGEGLRRLLDRGVGLYFLFTGGLEEYLYASQHQETFPELQLGRRARIRYLGNCTHTVTDLEHQRVLVDDIRAWSRSLAGAAHTVAATT